MALTLTARQRIAFPQLSVPSLNFKLDKISVEDLDAILKFSIFRLNFQKYLGFSG